MRGGLKSKNAITKATAFSKKNAVLNENILSESIILSVYIVFLDR